MLSKHYQLNHTPKAGKNIRLSSKKYILFRSCVIKKRKKLKTHTLSGLGKLRRIKSSKPAGIISQHIISPTTKNGKITTNI